MEDADGEAAAVRWLAAAAPDPVRCREEWERNPLGVTLLPAGSRWDVLIVGAGLGRGVLERLREAPAPTGPVLADFGEARVGFFVPPGAAVPRRGPVRRAGQGSWVVVPYPGRPTGGVRWLVLPDGRGTLADPVRLRRAVHRTVGAG
ncbi:hypothetical protein [Streptomyces xiaopingdaonensis]|uniref:hypothetical protein n=1 Tax=Streptomyces xiaopingdaonensis TaxID=1565415 RepID=UPI00030DBE94|nr:hypothetical protein [Streptomyces xiaopingdaonensis]